MNSFTKTVDLLQKAMDVSTLRYQVTANNLANAEVPNFKKTQVNFESELKRAIDSEQNVSQALKMSVSDPLHFESPKALDWQSVEPRLNLDYLTTAKANGNNVDAEEEAMNVLKIQMNYQLLAQMQAFEFNQLKIVIK